MGAVPGQPSPVPSRLLPSPPALKAWGGGARSWAGPTAPGNPEAPARVPPSGDRQEPCQLVACRMHRASGGKNRLRWPRVTVGGTKATAARGSTGATPTRDRKEQRRLQGDPGKGTPRQEQHVQRLCAGEGLGTF